MPRGLTVSKMEKYGKIWEQIIPTTEYMEILKLKDIKDKNKLYYPSDIWARVLFCYSVAYRNNEIDRNKLIESMIPFYHSRILSYVNTTKDQGIKDAEEYLENINRVFEKEKYFLIKQWDYDRRRLTSFLFE